MIFQGKRFQVEPLYRTVEQMCFTTCKKKKQTKHYKLKLLKWKKKKGLYIGDFFFFLKREENCFQGFSILYIKLFIFFK